MSCGSAAIRVGEDLASLGLRPASGGNCPPTEAAGQTSAILRPTPERQLTRTAQSITGHSMKNDTHVIETDSLTKRYGEIVAVDHLDLRVRRGEVYGPRTQRRRQDDDAADAARADRAGDGVASVLGEAPGSEHSLLHTGAMIETPAFYPHLSGRDNLRVLAKYTGTPETRRHGAGTGRPARSCRNAFRDYSLGEAAARRRSGALAESALLILDESRPTVSIRPVWPRCVT